MPFRFFDALVPEISDHHEYDCNPYHDASLLVACQDEKITDVVRQWRNVCTLLAAGTPHNRRLRDEKSKTIGDAGHKE